MKLTKKQLSASYVMKATASKSLNEQAYPGGFTKGDVANHGNSRFDRCPTASPEGKVESIPYVSFCTTSRERVWSPYQAFIPVHTPTGLEKHSQLRERHPSCNGRRRSPIGQFGIPATEMARRDGNGGDE
jgi:hypothetical protein